LKICELLKIEYTELQKGATGSNKKKKLYM
jgi:hypothetical protein